MRLDNRLPYNTTKILEPALFLISIVSRLAYFLSKTPKDNPQDISDAKIKALDLGNPTYKHGAQPMRENKS
jgi:hypothetical protein